MAYLRSTDEEPVYFYERVGGGWECCGCKFAPSEQHPDFITYFTELDDATKHLYQHVAAGHLYLHTADRVSNELRGRSDRQPDQVIAKMIAAVRESLDDASRICSDDADVPAEIRITTRELCHKLIEEATKEGDTKVVEACELMLQKLDERGVFA